MKNPNGYGTVTKLSGNRREPWAFRISIMEEQPDGTVKRKRPIIKSFPTRKEALIFQGKYNGEPDYNKGKLEKIEYTFNDIYELWKARKNSLKKPPSSNTWKAYNQAFKRFKIFHHRKIATIQVEEIQAILNAHNHMSRSIVKFMKVILSGMYEHATKRLRCVNENIVPYLDFEYTAAKEKLHTRFTDAEITLLWENVGIIEGVDMILTYIYTGLRPSELLEIQTENIFLAERYMIGGMKTDAGKERIIPIHEKIVPFIQSRCNAGKKYLYYNSRKNRLTYAAFATHIWKDAMIALNMEHTPHDCRHTFASLSDNAGLNIVALKLIIGHAIQDITKGVYTEKTPAELVAEVNKIP